MACKICMFCGVSIAISKETISEIDISFNGTVKRSAGS